MIGTLILQQLGGTNNNVRKLLIAYLLAPYDGDSDGDGNGDDG